MDGQQVDIPVQGSSRYYQGTDGVGITGSGDEIPDLNTKIVLIGKSVETLKLMCDEDPGVTPGNPVRFSSQEKVRWETVFFPYRKPTLVGWSSRLRRSREGGSRNSARNLDVSFARCPDRFGTTFVVLKWPTAKDCQGTV